MNLAMTLTVRNEADVIEDNLRYHRAQGVDFFVALDNGSTDGTVEILESYERAGILRLVRMEGSMLTIQRQGATRIGRLAHEMGADWVIHNDADEFWWPIGGGDLKQALAGIHDDFGMVLAPRTEFVARPDGDRSFAERLTIRESRFRRPPKTAHRAHPMIKMWERHPIDVFVKRRSSSPGLVGKPALRVQARHREESELELVLAPEFPIGVLHFPLRSFEQYRKKLELVADVNRLFGRDPEARALRDAYEAGRLRDVYDELVLDDDALAEGLAEGWLVEDTEFRDYLLACPGVLEDGESPPGSRAWPEQRRQAALDELREDGMYAISRYLQTVASKKRKRHLRARELKGLRKQARQSERELKRRGRELKRLRRRDRRLRRIEQSRWWRMRPRLPRARRGGH